MCDNSFVNVLLGCLACFLQSKKQKQNTSQIFNIYNWDTVGTESIQTPLNFSLFVILQPFAKII